MNGCPEAMRARIAALALALALVFWSAQAWAAELSELDALIEAALENNHELSLARSGLAAAAERPSQAMALPDPMFMFGYQNEGYDEYTFGEMEGAQWMFGLSQMIPYPGKLGSRGAMAMEDAAALGLAYEAARIEVKRTVKELYFDLFLAHKSRDILESRRAILDKLEKTALSRYSTGMSSQSEVVMLQGEKYMLMEGLVMLRQRQEAAEAGLNAVLDRDLGTPVPRPSALRRTEFSATVDELLASIGQTPAVGEKERMKAAALASHRMAGLEYYPDVTLAANLYKRDGEFEDMMSVTATVNIPVFYRSKQRAAVREAGARVELADHEIYAVTRMIEADLREMLAMAEASENLMRLYEDALIVKTRQGVEAGVAAYTSGKGELMLILRNLETLKTYEQAYWDEFVRREKTIARIEALTASSTDTGTRGEGTR